MADRTGRDPRVARYPLMHAANNKVRQLYKDRGIAIAGAVKHPDHMPSVIDHGCSSCSTAPISP